MAVNIQQELQRLYEQNKQQGTSLSERLNQMDAYTGQINPMVTAQTLDFSNRPATYNPLDDLASSVNFSERSRDIRSATSQDLERTQNAGLNLLQQLDTLAQRAGKAKEETPAEKMLRELKMAAAKKAIEDGTLRFNPNTGELEAGSGNSKDSKVKQEMITVIDQLLGVDTNPITGPLQGIPGIGHLSGSPVKKTEALYDQLKGQLSLSNREKLKGTGQISDYESKLLDKAASSLNRNLGDEDFRKTLEEIKAALSGEQQGKIDRSGQKKESTKKGAGRFTIERVE